VLKVYEEVSDVWRTRLADAGLRRVSDLLEHEPDALGLAGRWEALRKPGLGGRQRWRWEFTDSTGVSAVVYVKRYGRPDWKTQVDRVLRQSPRHSRAWWEYTQSRRLAAGYIPTPDAIGVAEAMRGPFERRSVVLMAAVPGDGFDRVWSRAARDGSRITRGLARHDMAVRLGRLASAFHQSAMCHRDLYLCHIFVDLDLSAARPPAFTIIDLARTLRPRMRRMRWILKDLSQLDCSARQIGATRADRLRFLLAYLGLQTGSARIRWYARRVIRRSDRILRRIERKCGAA
jgi:heptose I phosphotransferase